MKEEKTIIGGIYWNTFTKIALEIIRFSVSIVTVRILDPKDFGIISIATLMIYYANIFTSFGLNEALVQKKEISINHVNTAFTINLVISVILAILLYLTSSYVSNLFRSPESRDVLRILCVMLIGSTFYDISLSLLRRKINFKIIAISDIFKDLTASGITISLAVLGYKYWALVWGILIPQIIASCYLLIKSGWSPKIYCEFVALKELIGFSTLTFIRNQMSYIVSRFDRVIIGRNYNPTILGIYEKAKSLSQIPSEGIAANINAVLFPSFSRNQDRQEQLLGLLTKGVLIISTICIPIYIGLFTLAPYFIPILFGSKWMDIIPPFKILCIGSIFSSINGVFNAFSVGVGDYRKITLRAVISTLLFFALLIIFRKDGINIISLCWVIFSLLQCLLNYDLVRKRIEFQLKVLLKYIWPGICCSILMIMNLQITLLTFNKVTLLNLLVLIIVGSISYVLAAILIPFRILNDYKPSFLRKLFLIKK
jgi:O-antigen/teichoic acid export membrane protein